MELNGFVNKKLISIYGLFFFEKKPMTSKCDLSDIIEITFIFEDNILSIEYDDVGIGLKIDNRYQLENVDMLEFGLFHRMDVSNLSIFYNLVNTHLNRIEKIISDGYKIGITLFFSSGNVSILNLGDVLIVN